MSRKKIGGIFAALLLLVAVLVAGCGAGGAGQQAYVLEFNAQGSDTLQLDKNQPAHSYSRSEIRQELNDINDAEALGVQSTSFFMPPGAGPGSSADPQGSCPSIGAPVPATDEITNPHQIIKDNKAPINNGGGNQVIDQEDPIGIYQGATTGTWVMCIDPHTGRTYGQYYEGYVRVVMAPAVWDYTTHQPKLTGEPPDIFANLKVGAGVRKK